MKIKFKFIFQRFRRRDRPPPEEAPFPERSLRPAENPACAGDTQLPADTRCAHRRPHSGVRGKTGREERKISRMRPLVQARGKGSPEIAGPLCRSPAQARERRPFPEQSSFDAPRMCGDTQLPACARCAHRPLPSRARRAGASIDKKMPLMVSQCRLSTFSRTYVPCRITRSVSPGKGRRPAASLSEALRGRPVHGTAIQHQIQRRTS